MAARGTARPDREEGATAVSFLGRLFGRRDDDVPETPGMVTSGRRRRRAERQPAPRPGPAPAGPDPVIRTAMLQHVSDQTWLSSITDGDLVDDPAAWGPLDPRACSEQLLRWFDAGLIELHQDVEPPRDDLTDLSILYYDAADLPLIPADAARALLADPERWTDATPDGFACPVPTGRGRRTPAERWP